MTTATARFADYLRATINRDGQPYEDATINAYVSPGKHPDSCMTGEFCTLREIRLRDLDKGSGGFTDSSLPARTLRPVPAAGWLVRFATGEGYGAAVDPAIGLIDVLAVQ
jgi:hypothetical protein